MKAKFGHYKAPEYWSPNYGDVDWKLRRDRLIEQGEVETYNPVGFDSADGLVQEVTQENASFFINRVDPDMDMLAVADPRDGLEYTWFREDHPQNFEDLVRTVGRAALIHTSEYPLETVVEVYLRRRSEGIAMEYLDE